MCRVIPKVVGAKVRQLETEVPQNRVCVLLTVRSTFYAANSMSARKMPSVISYPPKLRRNFDWGLVEVFGHARPHGQDVAHSISAFWA